jgi:acyl-[acyl carrier protein]--UDP-N-acetylglucosamine O-acyltransferase
LPQDELADDVALHATADVAESASIGPGSRVWHLAQIGENAVIGRACVVGRGAYVGPGVQVGDHVKIQNYALVYQPAVLEDGVFVGPRLVLTNDLNPRSVDADGRPKSGSDWSAGRRARQGGRVAGRPLGLRRTGHGRALGDGRCRCGRRRRRPDFALVVGVPARAIGWVGRPGSRCGPGRRDVAL